MPAKIDQDAMPGGKAMATTLRGGPGGGIPWFAIIDPARGLLREHDDGGWSVDPAALLATADGPDGNVGCPMTAGERAHFVGVLDTTRRRLTDVQLARLDAALLAYARETVGERADGE
ncbi:MAG: hypothetical protein QF903_09705 [Planctomycetota bacterium]|nr:hypothetical protein [Planctomycetota bacterium]MDP6762335.1 hypothetical protein [Planctomycetota bacterium]MDP6989740.1 hypothetical protein [Planctomycetota bacterium]